MASLSTRSRKELFSPILVLVVTTLVDMTGFGMIIPLLPFYAARLNAGPTSLGVLLASFSIMQFIFSPLLGRWSDRVGRRPVLILSILTSIASFALFTVAESLIVLLLSRIVAGLATEGAVAQAYIADITSNEERAAGMGKVGAATGVGFILGPALGGFLSPYGFWAPGVAAMALGLLNLVFVLLFLPEPQVHKRSRPKLEEGFARRLLDALTRPLTGQVFIIYFVITLAFAAVPVIVPLLAIDFYGFTSVEMSYVFIYIGVLQILLQGFAMGRLTRRIGEDRLIVLGPLLMLIGIFVMPLLPNLAVFAASLAMISFGVGLTNTAVPSFVSQRTPPEEQGAILGVTQSVSSIARIPGPLIGGVAFELAGLAAPFFLSSLMLMIPFLLGCRVFHACYFKGL